MDARKRRKRITNRPVPTMDQLAGLIKDEVQYLIECSEEISTYIGRRYCHD